MQNEYEYKKNIHEIDIADPLLKHYVGLAWVGISIPVIIGVNGMMVQGHIISAEQYHEESIASIERNMSPGPECDAISSWHIGALNVYKSSSHEEKCKAEIKYVHLNNVAILNANGNPTRFNDFLMRINIKDINSFMLGSAMQ